MIVNNDIPENLIKFYNDLTIKKSNDYDFIWKALNITKWFILKNKRIIVGGTSIDYALKSKKVQGIYFDDALPDYDIISDTHWQDAYQLAVLLKRAGITGISVINALHPSTMKVRVNFKEIMDVTYIPTNIINSIPTIWFRGLQCIHPHYQFIDQHRALSYPYENAPRETIKSRPEKDMVRYDILYTQFNIRMLYIKNTNPSIISSTIPLDLLDNQCITGFVALNYWVQEAELYGFKTTFGVGALQNVVTKLGTTNLKEMIKQDAFDSPTGKKKKLNVEYTIPSDTYGISIYSNNINEYYPLVKEYLGIDGIWYEKFLDKLPRKIVFGDKLRVYNNDNKITAHNISTELGSSKKIYVANLQHIMMYLLVHYIIIMKMDNTPRHYSFYAGYLICRDLIEFAANCTLKESEKESEKVHQQNSERMQKFAKLLLPTAEIYGNRVESESIIVQQYNFDLRNKTKNIPLGDYTQPKNVYDRDLKYGKIPKSYTHFNVKDSKIFDMDGLPIKK